MTNTVLKNQIDTDITNKTASNSVSPTDVGENMKEVVNYTDQQIPYSFWRAKINTSTLALTVLNDGIGFTAPSLTNPSNGVIKLTKSGFFTSIASAKLDLIAEVLNASGAIYISDLSRDTLFPNDSILLKLFDMAGGQTSTPSGTTTIEIRIYN